MFKVTKWCILMSDIIFCQVRHLETAAKRQKRPGAFVALSEASDRIELGGRGMYISVDMMIDMLANLWLITIYIYIWASLPATPPWYPPPAAIVEWIWCLWIRYILKKVEMDALLPTVSSRSAVLFLPFTPESYAAIFGGWANHSEGRSSAGGWLWFRSLSQPTCAGLLLLLVAGTPPHGYLCSCWKTPGALQCQSDGFRSCTRSTKLCPLQLLGRLTISCHSLPLFQPPSRQHTPTTGGGGDLILKHTYYILSLTTSFSTPIQTTYPHHRGRRGPYLEAHVLYLVTHYLFFNPPPDNIPLPHRRGGGTMTIGGCWRGWCIYMSYSIEQ